MTSSSSGRTRIRVRNTTLDDIPGIIALCQKVYPESKPWNERQLHSHLALFPEGQLVAVGADDAIVGMAASLVVRWDDYSPIASWREFTSGGTFVNHDPEHGKTLYGAEVMVDPTRQRSGIGGLLYQARRDMVRALGLHRIRAGARLRGYHRYATKMDARTYVLEVIAGRIRGPTLSFQLQQKFSVLDVVAGYLEHDPESLGYAALIEWANRDAMTQDEYAARKLLYWNPNEDPPRAT